jgi:hypothetical protein
MRLQKIELRFDVFVTMDGYLSDHDIYNSLI